MPSKTSIEYGDFVSNPIKFRLRKDQGDRKAGRVGQACIKIAAECQNCWAESMNMRFWTGLRFTMDNMSKVEPFLDEEELAELATSKSISGKRVLVEFCSDLFGAWATEEWLARIFEVMDARRDVQFVLLTKRPARMYLVLLELQIHQKIAATPSPNILLGVTIGTQLSANSYWLSMLRLADLGWNTWVSAEPQLEYIDWSRWIFIKVLVAGGESGRYARVSALAYFRIDRNWCWKHGVKFFFKQWGEWGPGKEEGRMVNDESQVPMTTIGGELMFQWGKKRAGHELDGMVWREWPNVVMSDECRMMNSEVRQG